MKKMFFAALGILFFAALSAMPAARFAAVARAADKELVDINSASEKEIADLKGINKEEARKIIKNRPYARKDELVSKNVITEKDYDKIKDHIVARQHGSEMVDINNASEKEIAAIKGISDEQAKKIVKNRPYARKDELVSKKILDEKTYDKVKDQLVTKQSAGKDSAKESTTSDLTSKASGAIDSLTGKKK
jgi:DNA uptake protein ComE-like DNA-binding protein